jgi:hypothetical protein
MLGASATGVEQRSRGRRDREPSEAGQELASLHVIILLAPA